MARPPTGCWIKYHAPRTPGDDWWWRKPLPFQAIQAYGQWGIAPRFQTSVPVGTCPPHGPNTPLREAKHVARNILATIRDGTVRPFSYRSLGVFVPLGRFSGAAQVLGFKVSGFIAWWLYRTYYLFQLPRLERKIRVFIDWNLELIFHRDIVQHDITRSAMVSRGPLRNLGRLSSAKVSWPRASTSFWLERFRCYESRAGKGPR